MGQFELERRLSGSYWQRVSVDAVIVVAALIALVGFVRSLERFEARHLGRLFVWRWC